MVANELYLWDNPIKESLKDLGSAGRGVVFQPSIGISSLIYLTFANVYVRNLNILRLSENVKYLTKYWLFQHDTLTLFYAKWSKESI